MSADFTEVVERYIILLIGADNNPVPSIWHIQKELFILSQVNPKAQDFLKFEKHYNGAYSQVIQELIQEPVNFDDAIDISKQGFLLTEKGKGIFDEITSKNKTERFIQFLSSIKLIRRTYDKLAVDELLLLMYVTYPSFTELSNISNALLEGATKKKLLGRLLEKKILSEQRYAEISGD